MRLREVLFGKAKSPLDPKVFERLALAAFFAWVGIGADGLSSSCYGPAEIFDALGTHRALAPLLIIAVVVTVSVLSAGYANTIEAFPGGGGGYIVATKSLGRNPGLLCGGALIVDYVLTIAISMASGVEALFSALPASAQMFKLVAILAATVVMMWLNLRGVKESIVVLLPIFIGFLVTHTIAIAAALYSHGSDVGPAFTESFSQAGSIANTQGVWPLLVILIGAYTVGSGTYTGIEAISNTVPILKEPRVATAKRAMLYMAVSLAFTCGGLLLAYMLYGVEPVRGKTLNAVFLERWAGGSGFGSWFIPLTLLTEGALLFVAAQAGYLSGPRALASMAVDSWVPRKLRRLSDRLVIYVGICIIGIGAMIAIAATHGSVKELMVIYAFSVFVTFLLSQLGMCVHHLRFRDPGWALRLPINALAFLLSGVVAVSLVYFRFREGVGASAVVILILFLLCSAVRRHYDHIGRLLKRLDRLVTQVEGEPARGEPPGRDPHAGTAVVLVRGYNGAGIHTLMTVLRLFPNYFKNFIFMSVGEIDFDRFKGTREVEHLRESVERDLSRYVALARKWGFHAEHRSAFGVDAVDEVARVCPEIVRDFPRAMFFAGQLVFEQPTYVTRLLHELTAEEIQRRLQFMGLTAILLPIRVMDPKGAAS